MRARATTTTSSIAKILAPRSTARARAAAAPHAVTDMSLPSRSGVALPRTVDLPVLLWALATGAAVLLVGVASAERPTTIIVAGLALGVIGVALWRTDLAILLVVASAPVELAATATVGGLSLTKIAGALCFASFALYALRSRELLSLDWTQALVLLILAAAMLSTLQAREVGSALSTTARYASFAAIVILVR